MCRKQMVLKFNLVRSEIFNYAYLHIACVTFWEDQPTIRQWWWGDRQMPVKIQFRFEVLAASGQVTLSMCKVCHHCLHRTPSCRS